MDYEAKSKSMNFATKGSKFHTSITKSIKRVSKKAKIETKMTIPSKQFSHLRQIVLIVLYGITVARIMPIPGREINP